MTSSSHTSLCCVHQDSDGSYFVKIVLPIERQSGRRVIAMSQGLNLKSRDNSSALDPSDPSPMYVRTRRVLPLCSAFAKSKFNIDVVSEDILNSCFHSPDLYRGTVNSSCFRKSPSAICSSGPRKGLIVSERERSTSLAVSAREQGFSTSVSAGEQRLSICDSERRQDFSFDVSGRGHRRLSRVASAWRHTFQIIARLFHEFVVHVLGCLDRARVSLTSDITSMKAISQCTSALVKVPKSLCQLAKVSRVCA